MDDDLPHAWFDAGQIQASAAGRIWRLERAGNLDDLWEEMDAAAIADERIPYWTELWPSSLALAHWLRLRQEEIRGQLCLDLGCGLGFTALLGQCLGATVLGADYEAKALAFCRKNARINQTPEPQWLQMDWRAPPLVPKKIWRVWAGDIIYEKRFMAPVLELLALVLAPGGAAWIAEPGRLIFKDFTTLLATNGWSRRPVLARKVSALHPGENPLVTVWEISRDRD